MKFCPNCGYKYSDRDKFCRECGAKREPAQQTNGFLGMGMMGLNGMLFSPKGRHFHYSTSGMAFNSGCDYDIDETEDGKLTAKVRMPNLFASSAKAFEIEDALFDRITEIIDKYEGDKWDGFNEHAVGVCDGTSFSFSYRDGKERKISASGYMAFPEGIGAAMREIFDLIDKEYYIHFPDHFKTYRKTLEEEVIKEYGESCRDVTVGNPIGTVPYICGKPGCYGLGDSTIPEGFLTYRDVNYHPFGQKPEGELGFRSLALIIDKEADKENPKYNFTGIKFAYYGMDKPGEFKKLDERKEIKSIVKGQSGEYQIFTYEAAYGTVIGLFCRSDHRYGDYMQRFYFSLIRVKKDSLEMIDEASVTVSFEQGMISDEDLEKLCAVAEKAGIDSIANTLRQTQPSLRKYLSINTLNSNAILSLIWSSKIGDDLAELTGQLKEFEPIKDYMITVYRM